MVKKYFTEVATYRRKGMGSQSIRLRFQSKLCLLARQPQAHYLRSRIHRSCLWNTWYILPYTCQYTCQYTLVLLGDSLRDSCNSDSSWLSESYIDSIFAVERWKVGSLTGRKQLWLKYLYLDPSLTLTTWWINAYGMAFLKEELSY